MTKAIEQRWPIRPDVKAAAVERVTTLLDSKYDKIVALGVRCLLLMEKQNQDDKLKRTTINRQFEEVMSLARSVQTSPDPNYLSWQREQLLETQSEIAPLGTYVKRLKNKDDNGDKDDEQVS